LLLLARLIGGLGASNIGSAQAVVADVTPPEKRARGMGAIGAAIGLGFVVGPALGGLLASFGPTVPFWAAMSIALVNALLVLRFLPETRAGAAHASRRSPRAMAEGLRFATHHPAIARLIAINLLFTLAFSAMEAVFALFTQHSFHWTARQAEAYNGYIFTYVGVLIVIMQGGLVGRLVQRFGEQRLLSGGLLLLAGGLALLPFGVSLAPLLLALGILSVGEGAVTPTASALLSFATPSEAQGATLGLSQGVAGLGRVVGPLAATGLFAALAPGAPFLAGAALVLVAVLVALPTLPIPRHPITSASAADGPTRRRQTRADRRPHPTALPRHVKRQAAGHVASRSPHAQRRIDLAPQTPRHGGEPTDLA
jgi:MFS family permease